MPPSEFFLSLSVPAFHGAFWLLYLGWLLNPLLLGPLTWLGPIPFHSPDMFVLGFQEIVPLTAQQIVQTDPEKKYVAPFSFELSVRSLRLLS